MDVVAFTASGPEAPVLHDVVSVPGPKPASSVRDVSTPSKRVITSAASLRVMSSGEASQNVPVSLDGVITYYDPGWQMMFFQDRSSGIYVSMHGVASTAAVASGDRMQLSGVSGPGDFAPVVEKPRFLRLGRANLPLPLSIDKEAIFEGRADSQWVELEGIVQNIGTDAGRSFANLSWGPHTFKICLPKSVVIPSGWVDALVRVRGACATIFNSRRQLVGIQVFVPGMEQLTLLEAPRAGPFQAAITPINRLLQFSPAETSGHRVHLRGRVAGTHPTGPTWIIDDSGAVAIRDHNPLELSPGDVVDVAGFAAPGLLSAEIHDGNVQKLSSGPPIRPSVVAADVALAGGMHGQLVQTDGRLLSQFSSGQEQILLMKAGKIIFTVRGGANLPAFQNNSILRVAGICVVRARHYRGVLVPNGFEIRVDSPSAVSVVRLAPWLTGERTARAFAIAGFAILAVLAWVIVLRRRVEMQTRLIAQKLSEVESLRVKAEAASDAKSQFLANMSHEIRTPMNGILGMAELARQAESVEEQRECLEVIRSSGDSLLAILNDLLDLSKIESGKFELDIAPFCLRELISGTARTFAFRVQEKGLRFEYSVAAGSPGYLLGDSLRLRQILLNLLGNAVKFTDSGSVILTARFEGDGPDAGLRISVQDSGIGIPPHKQERIFESFRQADGSTARKYGGTGLGLSICRNLAALMGGRIWVQSGDGQGSTFHVSVPLKVAAGEAPDLVPVPNAGLTPQGAQGPLNILLAEDNPVNQTLAVRLLKKQGHRVTVASNGKLAIEAFSRESFDLILMDVQMPEVDGFEATGCIRRLEEGSKRIPIIAMTALNMKGDREKCLAAGMDGFVSKPIRLPELYAAIGGITAQLQTEPI